MTYQATASSPEMQDLLQMATDLLRQAVVAWSSRSLEDLGLQQSGETLSPGRPPRPELGDLAFACFPLSKPLRANPAQIARELAPVIADTWAQAAAAGIAPQMSHVEPAGPYVNLTFDTGALAAWVCARIAAGMPPYGRALAPLGRRTMVEYSAPNTNKPLHLGHVRNNLLGLSLCRILAAAGEDVIPVNLVNDRGIHIAKSMVAYQRWGAGATPAGTGRKGDHFVGDYYVRFGTELATETDQLARSRGLNPAALDDETRRTLEDETPLMVETRACLRRWEEGDPETRSLWARMNSWVYAGFDETYARLGLVFRKWYFESETYQRGKAIVLEGLARGLFRRDADGSVWAPFVEERDGLKDKLLLRSDGTSVYLTQDLGTTVLKFDDFHMDRAIFVVASEQTHHFRLLFRLLAQLGFPWAPQCHHLAYGMVELPHGMGKLKSREGRAVDADDLLDELAALARRKVVDGGFAPETDLDLDALADAIGQGALKMYLLQVGAEKNIVFDPDSTIEFEGDTGPAVQYSHARICSILRKALAAGRIGLDDLRTVEVPDPFDRLGTGAPVKAAQRPRGGLSSPGAASADLAATVRSAVGLRSTSVDAAALTSPEEKALALELACFPSALRQAADQLSPSPVAGFLLNLTKTYARFYHNCPVLRAESETLMRARIHLSLAVGATLRRGLNLLGITAPDAM